MATIRHGFTALELDEKSGWRATWELQLPNSLPPVTVFAGAHTVFPPTEVPTHRRASMLYSTYNQANRLVLLAYLSYDAGGLQTVLAQTTFGRTPNKYRVVRYQMQNTENDFRWANVPPEYLDEPWGRDVEGWWVANAALYVTYRTQANAAVFPVAWVCAVLVKGNLEARQPNTYLYICAIPLDETFNALQFLFSLPESLFSASYSWRYLPIMVTNRGIVFQAQNIVDFHPAGKVFVFTPSSITGERFWKIEVYPQGNDVRAAAKLYDLPTQLIPVYACHEHLYSGFNETLPPTILSNYEGYYATFNDATDNFTVVNISQQPVTNIPLLSAFSCDGTQLLGFNFQHIYFVATGNAPRVFLAPQPLLYLLVKNPNQQILYKYGFLPLSEIDDVSPISGLPTQEKMFVPPIACAISQGRAVIAHINKLFHTDIDSEANIKVLEVKPHEKGIKLGALSPCDLYIPQNYIQALPHFSAFYYTRNKALPFSGARISRPQFIPATSTALCALYVRAAEPGGSDWVGDWGKLLFLEHAAEETLTIEDVTLSVDIYGRVMARFVPPVSKAPIAFLVENPPYPYLRVGTPDSRYVIADSVSQPYLFEKDISGNNDWVKMGQYIIRERAGAPPYYIRVFVLPKHSQYIRIVAYTLKER